MIFPREDILRGVKNAGDIRTFLKEHSNGLVICDLVLKQCRKCGALSNEPDFGMYLPKDGRTDPPKFGNFAYRWMIDDDFEKVKDHTCCGKCGHTEMIIFKDSEVDSAVESGTLKCPDCGSPLEIDYDADIILFD